MSIDAIVEEEVQNSSYSYTVETIPDAQYGVVLLKDCAQITRGQLKSTSDESVSNSRRKHSRLAKDHGLHLYKGGTGTAQNKIHALVPLDLQSVLPGGLGETVTFQDHELLPVSSLEQYCDDNNYPFPDSTKKLERLQFSESEYLFKDQVDYHGRKTVEKFRKKRERFVEEENEMISLMSYTPLGKERKGVYRHKRRRRRRISLFDEKDGFYISVPSQIIPRIIPDTVRQKRRKDKISELYLHLATETNIESRLRSSWGRVFSEGEERSLGDGEVYVTRPLANKVLIYLFDKKLI